MKIGILTFHYAHNYGAVLQAYALKTLLERWGHDVVIINYQNPNIVKAYRRDLRNPLVWSDLIHPGRVLVKAKSLRGRKIKKASWERKFDKFDCFIKKYLLQSDSGEEVAFDEYDAIIAGSDQIWTPEITVGYDKMYLLDFPFTGRKIFYAASNASSDIAEFEKDYFLDKINEAYMVSVREEKLAINLERKLNKTVPCVLDPTMLLDFSDYSKIIAKENVEEKYVFAYYVKEDLEMSAFVKEFANKKNLKIIELHYANKKEFDTSYQLADLGPEEFLCKIKNAEYIITNSFHGTVFSILFHKEFCAYYKENSRISNLLNMFGLKERQVADKDLFEEKSDIDYSDVSKCLEKKRESSFLYLRKALEK